MKALKRRKKSPIQRNINILRTKGYKGFRLQGREIRTEFSFELTAYNSLDDRLIAIGKTPDEAYENLITRIDEALEG